MAIGVEPNEQFLYAGGKSDAGIGSAVIEVDSVAIGSDGIAARKDDVLHVTLRLPQVAGRSGLFLCFPRVEAVGTDGNEMTFSVATPNGGQLLQRTIDLVYR